MSFTSTLGVGALLLVVVITPPEARGDQATPPPHWSYEHDHKGALLGAAIAGIGDFDEDGFADFLVGAPTAGSGPAMVYLFRGGRTGFSGDPRSVAFGTWSRSGYGRAIAFQQPASKQDRPGVVIGVPTYKAGGVAIGRVALFGLDANAVVTEQALSSIEGKPGSRLGQRVSWAGDVNGDGYADVLVGAPQFNGRLHAEGAVFLQCGTGGRLESRPAWIVYGEQKDCQLGNSFAGGADVNHDGFADVLVGRPNYKNKDGSLGRVDLYLGRKTGLPVTPDWTGKRPNTDGRYGAEVAFLGDVDGDGLDDAAFSAGAERGARSASTVFVHLGTAAGFQDQPAWTLSGEQSVAGFGETITGVGDVNGDGLADFAIAAPHHAQLSGELGRIFLYLGTTNRSPLQPTLVIDGGKTDARFGQVIERVGDLNADGLPDFAVGSPRWNTSQGAAGRIDVFFGSRTGYRGSAHWVLREKELVRPEDFPRPAVSAEVAPTLPARPSPQQEAGGRAGRWSWFWLGGSALVLALGIGISWQRQKRRAAVALEAERARIARDLHDDLGARLTALSLSPATTDEGAKSAREMLQAMQEIVWAVSPENDTLESLVEFLGQKADELLAAARIRSYHDFPLQLPPVPLPAPLRKNLFLAVREALTNVVKHAGATEVWLRVQAEKHRAVFVVEDNGRGMLGSVQKSGATPLPSGGNGLVNLRRRMQEIGGELEIIPRPEGGTRVCFTIPMPK